MTGIYDTILLGSGPQDLDILECRLTEISDMPEITAHVIVEGSLTFTGNPKPLYYAANEARFARWASKIRYLPITPVTGHRYAGYSSGEAWEREAYSREAVKQALADAMPGDLVLHGDADEIPSRDAIRALPAVGLEPRKLRLRLHSFCVDWQHEEPWLAPSVARWGEIRDSSVTHLREHGWPVLSAGLENMGWHLSWMGGPDAMRTKLHSFSHTETQEMIGAGIERGDYIQRGRFWGGGEGRSEQLLAVTVDDTWPEWVRKRRCPPQWFRAYWSR